MTKKPKYRMVVVDVTEADIERAIPADSGHCAIADAIQRQLPGASKVSVDLQTIRWSDRAAGVRYVYLTPRVAQALLLDFDNGDREYCQPLSFRLQNPAQVIPIRNQRELPSHRQTREERAAARATKQANYEARIAAGETLTADERRSLSMIRATAKRSTAAAEARKIERPKPTTEGPRTVESVDPVTDTAVVTGGQAPVMGALAHGQGRIRRFGVKSAGSPRPA